MSCRAHKCPVCGCAVAAYQVPAVTASRPVLYPAGTGPSQACFWAYQSHRDSNLPPGLGWAGETAGGKDASNLTMKRETSLGKYVLTHMSLKAEQRAEIQWAFPRSPYMHRSHSSTGSLRWLSSTPATCYHTTIIPDRNLILCPLSSKHVQLGQF